MGFVVERTSRSGRVEERFVIARPRASIGRAYDNDIILSDPYTTAHQLVVTNDLNGLAVEVVDDQGATQKSGVPIGEGRTPIESGVEITVGRTHLRVWTTNHPVPPPLAFDRLDQVFDTFTQPSWMAALLGAWLGVQMADFFLVRFREVAFSDAALAMLSPMLMPIAWALIWSVISRISRGEPRFFLHLLAAIIFQVFTTLAEWLVKLVAFNTGSLA